jgi:hypothetical protein
MCNEIKFTLDGIQVEAWIDETKFNEDYEGGIVQRELRVTVIDASGNAVTDPGIIADAENWALIKMSQPRESARSAKDVWEQERERQHFDDIADTYGSDYITFTK